MNLTGRIAALEKLGRSSCGGCLPGEIVTYRDGDATPDVSPCPRCGSSPTVVREVVVRSRADVARWQQEELSR